VCTAECELSKKAAKVYLWTNENFFFVWMLVKHAFRIHKNAHTCDFISIHEEEGKFMAESTLFASRTSTQAWTHPSMTENKKNTSSVEWIHYEKSILNPFIWEFSIFNPNSFIWFCLFTLEHNGKAPKKNFCLDVK
jgi:hypothetical protein